MLAGKTGRREGIQCLFFKNALPTYRQNITAIIAGKAGGREEIQSLFEKTPYRLTGKILKQC